MTYAWPKTLVVFLTTGASIRENMVNVIRAKGRHQNMTEILYLDNVKIDRGGDMQILSCKDNYGISPTRSDGNLAVKIEGRGGQQCYLYTR